MPETTREAEFGERKKLLAEQAEEVIRKRLPELFTVASRLKRRNYRVF
jgi:tRNA(Ser,Leu) C12 N-acetylase TAN1